MFFWYLMAGILLAVIIATVIVVVSNIRHRRAVARGEVEPAAVEAPGEDVFEVSAEAEVPRPRTGEPVEAPVPGTAHGVQTPELPSTRFARLRQRLASSNNALARGLADLLASDKISAETWEDFEATLISSDLGVGPTTELVAKLKSRLSIDGVSDPVQAKAILREELICLVDPSMDRQLHLDVDEPPAVIMVVGVNGTGKTTTVGKLARELVASDKSVLLGAADTFRAAAADQLTTWGERIGVETVRGAEGADPASVAFDAVRSGRDRGVDVVLVDTAGRLHNKTNLMDELGKVKRVIEKIVPVKETLLVLDATTGQNGLVQARVFAEVAQITGIVLTKLDGSAKGGIVVAVQRELGVPVKFIGLGEGADDLAGFDAVQFVDGLLGQ
ncbi:MAG: signal recognition particle-docking protein FtsY [Propionibacteriaceae bacterium]|nr:signal recognition particle-docking protein FtsY [Propionibacteriaceae bacterium]